ncbi:hypothetical protein HMPREF0352_2083 [Enterococcus faecium TX1330]|nr:hypothetical protein HMPREF0352_2083 [Enterococcus faecium TX1330]
MMKSANLHNYNKKDLVLMGIFSKLSPFYVVKTDIIILRK